MKKHLFAFAIIAHIIFLSSCSLVKRHYTTGYYVSHNSAKSLPNITKEQVSNNKTRPSLHSVENMPYKNKVDENSKSILLKENEIISASNNKTSVKLASATPHKTHVGYNVTKIFKEKNIKSLTIKKAAPDDIVVDALSLFWIVILILLIVWLVALLTGGWGLGWTIHVLLVIALILLILWLLRII